MNELQEPTAQAPIVNNNAANIEGLKALISFLEANPMLHEFHIGNQAVWAMYCDPEPTPTEAAKMLGGKCEKDASENYFKMGRKLGGTVELTFYWNRESVCKKVVTTETVTVEELTPEAKEIQAKAQEDAKALLESLPRVPVTKEVERVTWECPDSLLKEAK
jgi:hypothetical protein